MNIRKTLLYVLTVLGFLCIASLPEKSTAQSVDLKFSSPWPPTHPQHTMLIEPWAKRIHELTGGKITVTLFPSQVLGKAADHHDMAAKGVCDIALTSPNYTPGRFQLLPVFWLPFMVTTAEDTSVALWKSYEKYMKEEFRDVKVLWMYVHAPGQIFTRKKPVKTLEDLKGMKIRATNPRIQESLKIFGAVPVSTPVPEVYNALERGVVDGTAMPFEGLWVFKQHEVVDYGTICDLYTQTFPIVMNLNKWDALPTDVKKIMEDNIGLELSRQAGVVYDRTEATMKEKIIQYGVKVNNLPSEDLAKMKTVGEKIAVNWAKEMEAKGLPANALLNDARNLLGIK